MSKEKLTVENTVSNIYYHMEQGYRIQAEGHLTSFLKQIRDEIISSTYSYNFISQRNIENVFNKYLNEKGGK